MAFCRALFFCSFLGMDSTFNPFRPTKRKFLYFFGSKNTKITHAKNCKKILIFFKKAIDFLYFIVYNKCVVGGKSIANS